MVSVDAPCCKQIDVSIAASRAMASIVLPLAGMLEIQKLMRPSLRKPLSWLHRCRPIGAASVESTSATI
jgi:hypothetical protein